MEEVAQNLVATTACCWNLLIYVYRQDRQRERESIAEEYSISLTHGAEPSLRSHQL
jgi:hypothetical protein